MRNTSEESNDTSEESNDTSEESNETSELFFLSSVGICDFLRGNFPNSSGGILCYGLRDH